MADTRSLLRRFFSCGRPYKRPVILDFGCAVVSGRLRLGFPLAANYLVDELLSGRDLGAVWLRKPRYLDNFQP